MVTGFNIREIQFQDAKATFSAVVDEALRGEPSVIIRNGKPEAVIISFEEWTRLSRVPSFAQLLMAAPFDPCDVADTDETPPRDLGL